MLSQVGLIGSLNINDMLILLGMIDLKISPLIYLWIKMVCFFAPCSGSLHSMAHASHLFLQIFLLEQNHHTHSLIDFLLCFHATRALLSSYNRGGVGCMPKLSIIWDLKKELVAFPGLEQCPAIQLAINYPRWGTSVVSDSLQPMDCSPPGSSVHGILQARILEWVAMSSFTGYWTSQISNV